MTKSFLRLAAILAVLAALLASPLLAKATAPAQPPAQSSGATESKPSEERSDSLKSLALFSDVLARVRSEYVDPVGDDKLIENALNGMLSALDPHSGYMNKKNFQEMQTQTKGEFGGLGIEVTMENNIIKVISPIDDTPAAKAKIQPGDLITHIDSKIVTDYSLSEAVDHMRGVPGTKVTLTLRRGGLSGKPFDVALIRAVIRVQSVKWEAKDDVAYIRLTAFNEQTQIGLDKAMVEASSKIGPKLIGYVLDLRNNPGGLLDEAISVSSTFLDAGKEVVSTRGRHKEEDQQFAAKGGDKAHGKPIVVLINGGSASASEIVAGALQDHKRAILVGTKSFGKGSVQTIIPVPGGSAMRLTTARYYTPSGRSIQALGIEPDITVQPAKLEKVSTEGDLHEADLKGALQNETVKESKQDKAVSPDETTEEGSPSVDQESKKGGKKDKDAKKTDAPFDYQLARALDLIHGIHLFESRVSVK